MVLLAHQTQLNLNRSRSGGFLSPPSPYSPFLCCPVSHLILVLLCACQARDGQEQLSERQPGPPGRGREAPGLLLCCSLARAAGDNDGPLMGGGGGVRPPALSQPQSRTGQKKGRDEVMFLAFGA